MSCSVTITFELQYKSAFEATSLLAGFLAVAVFVVIYGCSSLSKALDFKAFDPCYDRKPTQEENREENKKVPIRNFYWLESPLIDHCLLLRWVCFCFCIFFFFLLMRQIVHNLLRGKNVSNTILFYGDSILVIAYFSNLVIWMKGHDKFVQKGLGNKKRLRSSLYKF